MYVLHTVLTIVSGELFYQTYRPMVSPIGSEAVRSSPPSLSLSLSLGTHPRFLSFPVAPEYNLEKLFQALQSSAFCTSGSG